MTSPRIARVWRGRTKPGLADEYAAYLYEHGVKKLDTVALGVQQFRRDHDDGTADFVVISYWESFQAMARYADADDVTRTRHLERDPAFLIELPAHVEVYDIAASLGTIGGNNVSAS